LKLKIDWPGIRAAIRTAGALMLGNTFIAVLILGKNMTYELWVLFFLGMAAIIVPSIEKRSGS
jgi:hypothetical protein